MIKILDDYHVNFMKNRLKELIYLRKFYDKQETQDFLNFSSNLSIEKAFKVYEEISSSSILYLHTKNVVDKFMKFANRERIFEPFLKKECSLKEALAYFKFLELHPQFDKYFCEKNKIIDDYLQKNDVVKKFRNGEYTFNTAIELYKIIHSSSYLKSIVRDYNKVMISYFIKNDVVDKDFLSKYKNILKDFLGNEDEDIDSLNCYDNWEEEVDKLFEEISYKFHVTTEQSLISDLIDDYSHIFKPIYDFYIRGLETYENRLNRDEDEDEEDDEDDEDDEDENIYNDFLNSYNGDGFVIGIEKVTLSDEILDLLAISTSSFTGDCAIASEVFSSKDNVIIVLGGDAAYGDIDISIIILLIIGLLEVK